MYVASSLATEYLARTTQRNRADSLPEGLLNVEEWSRTEVTATGRTVPYVPRAFRYEKLWDLEDTGDFFPLLNETMSDMTYINGQKGFQVIRLRWAQGDTTSGIDVERCFLSLGTGKGLGNVINKYYFSAAQHVYDAKNPSGNASLAWSSTGKTGVYNVISTGFGYFEALIRYDPSGVNGQTLYGRFAFLTLIRLYWQHAVLKLPLLISMRIWH